MKVFPEDLPDETAYIIVQQPPQVHAPVPARVSTPLSGHLSDQSRPVSRVDITADINKIADKIFNPVSQYISFLNEFEQGSRDLPVTEGSITGLYATEPPGRIMHSFDLSFFTFKIIT
ncbi:hypothetical protein BG003_007085 [Podila horticola]|nr:hypothetical protein BG003_007085 [Podila horticola]